MKPVPADETLRLSPKSGQQLQTACLPRVRRATCGRLQLNVRRLVQNVSLVKRLSWGPRPPAALARRPRAPPGVTRVRGLFTSPPADPFALLHSPLSDFWWGTCVCPSGALPSFPSWWPRGHWPPGPGRRVPHHAPPASRRQVGRCQRVGGSRGAGRRFVPEWRVSPRSALRAHPSRPFTVPKGPDPWCGVPRPQVPAGNGGGLAAGPEWCTQGPGAQGRPRGAVGHTPPLPSLSSAYVQLLRDTGAVRSQEPAHSRAAPGTCEGQPSD